MARIIYKKGMEGQNNLSSIEGIEIELLNGQKALIYPKYAERKMLTWGQISEWDAAVETEIESLKVEDTNGKTRALLRLGSPAAEWVSQYCSDTHSIFCLPSLIASQEIQYHKEEIDALAETIGGADFLIDYIPIVWSCSRFNAKYGWGANGYGGWVDGFSLTNAYLVVPVVLYR